MSRGGRAIEAMRARNHTHARPVDKTAAADRGCLDRLRRPPRRPRACLDAPRVLIGCVFSRVRGEAIVGFACGIVGLPNVGKSTLFNALSATQQAEAANYPFCTIEPNVGVVSVADPRMDALVAVVKPKKVVPTTMEFVDIAGLVRGASKGEGLGNQFLANIREVNAIAHVVRCFEDENIVHVEGRIDPAGDVATIDTELGLKDLESVDKRMARAGKAMKGPEAKTEKPMFELCTKLSKALNDGLPVRAVPLTDEERPLVKELQLLTSKKVMYVANVAEKQLAAAMAGKDAHVEALRK